MALFLVEVPEDEAGGDTFVCSHQLDFEGYKVRRLTESTLKEYDYQQELDAAFGAN